MDKIKNVLNPGFKEQDDLLYDTGASGQVGNATSNSNTTTTENTGASSGLGSTNESALHASTSRTATNQKDHMVPQDYAAARAVGTEQSATSTSGHELAHQPGLSSTTGTGSADYPHHEPHQFQGTSATNATTQQGDLVQAQTGDALQPKQGDLTQPQHSHHMGRDAAIGTGATSAGVGAHHHHEHREHNKLRKENPATTATSGAHTTRTDQHEHHTGRDAAVGAGAIGAAGAAHEHHKDHSEQEPKKNILQKIFSSKDKKDESTTTNVGDSRHADSYGAAHAGHTSHNTEDKKDHSIISRILHPGGQKHDETTMAAGTTHNQSHTGHDVRQARPLTDESPANASIGGANTVAPVGAGVIGAGVAAHEVRKHHHTDTAPVTGSTTQHHATSQHQSTAPAVGHGNYETVGSHQHGVIGHSSHHGTTQQHNIGAGTGHSVTQEVRHPFEAGSANTPLGVGTGGTIGAVAGGHEYQKDHNQANQGSNLTHHQHNTGNTLSDDNDNCGYQHQHWHNQNMHEGVVGETHHHRYDQSSLTGHEQRDLHQHGGNDTGLSHHVHNEVTSNPNTTHGNTRSEENAGFNRATAGSSTGAGTGAASAGITPSSIGHQTQITDDLPHTTPSGTGPASKTLGPHSSNILNVLDPRVKPDVKALNEDKTQNTAYSENEYQATPRTGDAQMTALAERPKHEASMTSGTGAALGSRVAEPQLGRSTGLHDNTRATDVANQAREGEHAPHLSVAGYGKQVASSNPLAASGAAGTHSNPAYTDDVKGVVSGERGHIGDPSNVYSKQPLDDRVTMPGSFPGSAANKP